MRIRWRNAPRWPRTRTPNRPNVDLTLLVYRNTSSRMQELSIVIPARNEAENLRLLIPLILARYPNAEIVLVDDGSTDETPNLNLPVQVRAIRHPYSMGNGAAIKTGARMAQGRVLVLMDGDGQHRPEDIDRLLAKLAEGYDMAVGARSFTSQASVQRALGNVTYNRLASWMTGHPIEDLTSGFRAVVASKFRKFLYLLPNGFSYPTTITMAFFRSAYSVAYVPVTAAPRQGNSSSNIRLFRDGIKFLIIILKVGALFSPMRLFLPVSAAFFALGIAYYTYTYITTGRLTNMTALLVIAAMLTFLIGIVSEQVSQLHYRDTDRDRTDD